MDSSVQYLSSFFDPPQPISHSSKSANRRASENSVHTFLSDIVSHRTWTFTHLFFRSHSFGSVVILGRHDLRRLLISKFSTNRRSWDPVAHETQPKCDGDLWPKVQPPAASAEA